MSQIEKKPGKAGGSVDAEALRRTISTARAAAGMSWGQVAKELGARGWKISSANLMTRHSRMAFRIDEYLLILDVLGVREVRVKPHLTGAA
jgi:hypothetical protein